MLTGGGKVAIAIDEVISRRLSTELDDPLTEKEVLHVVRGKERVIVTAVNGKVVIAAIPTYERPHYKAQSKYPITRTQTTNRLEETITKIRTRCHRGKDILTIAKEGGTPT